MRQRQFGVQFDGFLPVFFRNRTEVKAQQKSRGQEISGRGIGRNLEHLCEGATHVRVIFRLDVGDAKNVGSIDARAGIPRLHFFEIWNCFGGFASKIQREAHELSGFVVVRIFSECALQIADRVRVITFAVVSGSKFMIEIFRRGVGFREVG